MRYFKKFYGENANTVKSPDISEVIFAWIGGFIAISIIGYFTMSYNLLFVMGSFGASCVLLFAFPKSPFSQPRNLILGHLFSTFIGLCFLAHSIRSTPSSTLRRIT
ncbi:MAG: HPP family protein [Thiovulaceae bacterium]|nr:HPP family protein [Sulfurimonadaceae bacterium]